MQISQKLKNLRKKQLNLKQEEFAKKINVDVKTVSYWENGKNEPNKSNLLSICNEFNLPQNYFIENVKNVILENKVTIPYYPDVVFSAGYGIEIYDDGAKEYITLDERLFRTDRGTKINPKNCELLTISGNSMYPKWEDGDRFILDKSDTSFVDGQIFAFKLNGECYIKEICLLGKRAKAIPLNKSYDEFYIEPEDDLQIFGRVIPKVRL